MMDPLKPKKRPVYPLAVSILGTAGLLLLLPRLPHLRALLLPPCGHIVLISAARHGTSWFLNSAERCTASSSFEPLNRASELWNRATHGPVRDVSPSQAGSYVEQRHSLKIFPLTYYQNYTQLGVFFDEVRQRGVPVFLLTRRLEDAFASYQTAVNTNRWNVNSVQLVERGHPGASVKEGEGLEYAKRHKTYFVGVRKMLRERGIGWDEFEFEDVLPRRVIVGEVNQCSIRNCNL